MKRIDEAFGFITEAAVNLKDKLSNIETIINSLDKFKESTGVKFLLDELNDEIPKLETAIKDLDEDKRSKLSVYSAADYVMDLLLSLQVTLADVIDDAQLTNDTKYTDGFDQIKQIKSGLDDDVMDAIKL